MISLPVSCGEALDKLSILEIKMDRICDPSRRQAVSTEYHSIKPLLDQWLLQDNCNFWYQRLKDVNTKIWDQQDILLTVDATQRQQLALVTMDDNNQRFRLKNKLNQLLNSHLREQKGYADKVITLHTTSNMIDHINLIPTVRFLSVSYDRVVLKIPTPAISDIYQQVQLFYQDDRSIILQTTDLAPAPLLPLDLPFGLDSGQIDKFFYINHTPNSIQLYQIAKSYQYVFVHNVNIEQLSPPYADILIIDPERNWYQLQDKYFYIAEQMVGHPVVDYYHIIEHADRIELQESYFTPLFRMIKNA